MANPFLSSEQQGIVVFWMWKSLGYWKRMLLSLGCILAGLSLQYYWLSVWWGIPFLIAGNLFLLVRGYDNRVKFGKYAPEAGWEQVEQDKLGEVEQFIKKMKKWDRSLIDISNGLGTFTFIILFFGAVAGYIISSINETRVLLILVTDAVILLIPHWFTGKRAILDQPNLLLKMKLIKKLLRKTEDRLQYHQIEYFMLLKGKKTQVPEDVKFRVKIHNQNRDFLGFYGQIVINRVGSTPYPYFYVVLVAKKGYGLRDAFNEYSHPRGITKEYKEEGDVEVFVIRQTTTRRSGYHTNDRKIRNIFLEGLNLAEIVAVT